MTTLCDLATKLPDLIGTLLDRETKLKKGRFREETLTDIFTASLAAFAGPSLIIEYPDEAATGSDLDLDFWHVDSGRRLRLRIQAKRLNAETIGNKEVAIKRRAYTQLLHKVGATGVYQFERLVGCANAYLPLYMFYNHASVVQDPCLAGQSPEVHGINLAFADDIADELRVKVAGGRKEAYRDRLANLRPYFFDLSTIICARAKPGNDVPSPYEVETSLGEVFREGSRGEALGDFKTLMFLMDMSRHYSMPEGGHLPADGPAIRFNPEVKRPKVTFISGRTEDKRTPKISPQSRSD